MAEPLQLDLHAKVDMRRVDRAANDIQRRFSTLGNDAADDFARQFQTGLRSIDSRSAATQAAREFSSAGTRAGRDFAGSATSAMRGDFQAAGRDAGRDFQRSFERQANDIRVDVNARTNAADAGDSAGDAFAGGFAGAAGLTRLAGAGGPIAAAIAGGAVAGFKLLGPQIQAAMQAEVSRDTIQGRLGLDDATMADVAKAAADAFGANFGTSIDDNLSAAQQAFKRGLLDPSATEDQIQGTIEQLQTLATVMESDVGTAANSVGQLVRTGMAKDSTQAFDLLTVGAQAVQTDIAELSDVFSQNAATLKQFGIDGQSAMSIFKQSIDAGAPSAETFVGLLEELAGNAGNEAEAFQNLGLNAEEMARKLTGGGDGAKQALDQLLDSMRNTDPITQANSMISLFGEEATAMSQAILAVDLSSIVTEFQNVEGASQSAADKFSSNAANEWATAANSIKAKLAEIRDSLDMGSWFNSVPRAINQFLAEPPKGPTFAPGVPAQVGTTPGPAVAPPASVPLPSAKPVNPLDVLAGAGRPGDGIGGPTSADFGGVNGSIQQIHEIARQFGLTMTSGRRNEPGSYHNSGSAGDFSGSPDAMRAFAEYLADNFGPIMRELIYTDSSGGVNLWNGKPHTYSAGTAADHRDHVHAAVTEPLTSTQNGPVPVYITGTEHGAYPSDQTSPTSSSSTGEAPRTFGVPLDEGLGLDRGLSGLADNLVRMAGNALLQPFMASLGASQPAPVQSYGAAPTMGTAPTFGMPMPSAPTLGAPTMPGSPIGAPPGTMPPGPFGPPAGPLPGPQQPVGRSPGQGFQAQGGGASGGALLQGAIGAGAMAADVFAPGAGMAVQKGGQLAERAIKFGGQLAGIGVSGLMETFALTGDSALADPSKSWLGRLAGGLSQMKPAEETTAGQTRAPVEPQKHEGSGAPPGPQGPTVSIGQFVQAEGRNGQQAAQDLAFQAWSSKGKR